MEGATAVHIPEVWKSVTSWGKVEPNITRKFERKHMYKVFGKQRLLVDGRGVVSFKYLAGSKSGKVGIL